MDDYRWDLFISYRRRGPAERWVQRLLYEEIVNWLPGEMSRDPAIFIDTSAISVGTQWSPELEAAIRTSRCMLCVWSPEYFRSSWCKAEWESMVAREDEEAATRGARPRIIYPLLFQDGDHLPQDARAAQWRDMKAWSSMHPELLRTARGQAFTEEVQRICQELSAMIAAAPPFRADFPFKAPTPAPVPPVALPRLS